MSGKEEDQGGENGSMAIGENSDSHLLEMSKKLYTLLSELEIIESNEGKESYYDELKLQIPKLSEPVIHSALIRMTESESHDSDVMILFLKLCFPKTIKNFSTVNRERMDETKYLTSFFDYLTNYGREDVVSWMVNHMGVSTKEFFEVLEDAYFAAIDFSIFKGHYSMCKILVEENESTTKKKIVKKKAEEEEGEGKGEEEDEKYEFCIDSNDYHDIPSRDFVKRLNELHPKFRFVISVEDLSFRSKDHKTFLAKLQKGLFPLLSNHLCGELTIQFRFQDCPGMVHWGPPKRSSPDCPPYDITFGSASGGMAQLTISLDTKLLVPRSLVLKQRYTTDTFFEGISRDVMSSFFFYRSTRERITNFLTDQFSTLFAINEHNATTALAKTVSVGISPKSEFKTHEMWKVVKYFEQFREQIVLQQLPSILDRLKKHKKKTNQQYEPLEVLKINLDFSKHLKSQHEFESSSKSLTIDLNLMKILYYPQGWTEFYDILFMSHLTSHELGQFLRFSNHQEITIYQHQQQQQKKSRGRFMNESLMYLYRQDSELFLPNIINEEWRSPQEQEDEEKQQQQLKIKIFKKSENSETYTPIAIEEKEQEQLNHHINIIISKQKQVMMTNLACGMYQIKYYNKINNQLDFLIGTDKLEIFDFQFSCVPQKEVIGFLNVKLMDPRARNYHKFISSIHFSYTSDQQTKEIPKYQQKDGLWKLNFDDSVSDDFVAYRSFELGVEIVPTFKSEKKITYVIKDVMFVSALGITEKLASLKKELGIRNSGTQQIHVEREDILLSSMKKIFYDEEHKTVVMNGRQFRDKVFRVNFRNEMGSDAGGLRRSWFSLLMKEIIQACFVIEEDNNNYYNLNRLKQGEDQTRLCEFMGRLFAKIIVMKDSCPLHQGVGLGIFKLLLGEGLGLSDLPYLDGGLGERFLSLASLSGPDLNLCKLNFVYYDRETNQDLELVPNGEKTGVSESNLGLFMDKYIHKKFSYLSPANQSEVIERFRMGFFDVIPLKALKANSFRAKDLHWIIEGDAKSRQLDVDTILSLTRFEKESAVSSEDFERTRKYWLNLFSHKTNKLHEFSEEEEEGEGEFVVSSIEEDINRKNFLENLLFFFTGYFHLPSFGFKEKLVVRVVYSSSGVQQQGQFRLPTARTCVFQLSLPVYKSYKMFLKALQIVVKCGFNGFGFQ